MDKLILADVSKVEPFALAPGAMERRENLVKATKAIVGVVTVAEQSQAVMHCSNIHAELKAVEAARKEIKKPVLELSKKIDKLADDYCSLLTEEKERVGKLISVFQISEDNRIREEQRLRQLEEQRLEKIRIEAEKEAARLSAAAQELLKTNESKPESQDKADVKDDSAKEEEAIAAHMAAVAASEVLEEATGSVYEHLRKPEPIVQKVAGLVSKDVVKWEITDALKVYQKHPHFFSLEPKKSIINGCITKSFECEGMKVWVEKVSNFRT